MGASVLFRHLVTRDLLIGCAQGASATALILLGPTLGALVRSRQTYKIVAKLGVDLPLDALILASPSLRAERSPRSLPSSARPDLNKVSWRTDRFIATDTYVKEGLAQYYTEQIMRGLGDRLPDGLATFLAKTAKQSAPYTTYQNWLGEKTQPSPEATRLAMLEFRNALPPVFEHQQFVDRLKSAQAQISGSQG